jgi:hypothetical protein
MVMVMAAVYGEPKEARIRCWSAFQGDTLRRWDCGSCKQRKGSDRCQAMHGAARQQQRQEDGRNRRDRRQIFVVFPMYAFGTPIHQRSSMIRCRGRHGENLCLRRMLNEQVEAL